MNTSAQEQWLLEVAESAARTRDRGGQPTTLPRPPLGQALGVVSAVTGGSYTVAIADTTGVTVGVLPGVLTWGCGPFQVGDRVVLLWPGLSPHPVISSGGGSGFSAGTPVVVISAGVLTLE